MKNNSKKKLTLDVSILAVCCLLVLVAYYLQAADSVLILSFVAAVVIGIVGIADLVRCVLDKMAEGEMAATGRVGWMAAQEVVLLDEQEKPVKSWPLSGKTSMIIGRNSKDEEVDIDLCDCEYSALIDIQHAVLNYSLDCWYLEDLDSHNGVKVKKVEDGECYYLTGNRPCKIIPGDIIYIAKTKLLFT